MSDEVLTPPADRPIAPSARGRLAAYLTAPTAHSLAQARAQQAWFAGQRFLSNPTATAGAVIVVLLVAIAAAAPLLATHDPLDQNIRMRLLAPTAEHWFGTDELGRDIYSRVVYGSRTTLMIVALVAVIAAPLGLVVGTVSGYLGGVTDLVLMRVTDLFLAFPSLILALAFVAAMGPGLENAIVAIALTAWPPIARLARAETLTVRTSEYIAAVRMQGASWPFIVATNIVPMCVPSVIVRITLNMAGIILAAAGLGFLGLGAQPPTPEWGAMLSGGRQYILNEWWLCAIPGVAIVVVSLAFNLFGDGLRDVLDPRSD
ncbi:ABC transporter permease [Acuticoccus sp.]|uniref:ABC transporter permease n=1 Tax=Acuticoccus sp. TaxID=1904378 RepID=UPI003B51550C